MNLWKERTWKPMLLKEIDKPFQDKDYYYEIKFDGIRAIIYASKNKVEIRSRNGKNLTSLYPELQSIKNLVTTNTIFDGEIIALENGKPSFLKLQERMHLKDPIKIEFRSQKDPVIFMCFDLLYHEKNLIDYPLFKRKEELNKFPENEIFVKVKNIEEQGILFFQNIKKLNLEGMVAKNKNSLYIINQRTDSWIKIKNKRHGKFYIVGYFEKEQNNVISLILAKKNSQEFIYVGKVSMAKKNPLYKKIKEQPNIKSSIKKTFKEKIIFISPKYQCQVEFLEYTENGQLRHPTFKK